jgi:hypothetical protein
MMPPSQVMFKNIADKFHQVNIKSVVIWVNNADASLYFAVGNDFSISYKTCYKAATDFMIPLDIELIGSFSFNSFTDNVEVVQNIVRETKSLAPDVVMYCDVLGVNSIDWGYMHPLTIMKEQDYTPKQFTMMNTIGTKIQRDYLSPKGLIEYVIEPVFGNPSQKGSAYTEDAAPYSSLFRKSIPTTVAEEVLAGSNIRDNPSSSLLFYNFTLNELGQAPTSFMYTIWATFDVVEQAIYKASTTNSVRVNGEISGQDVFGFLRASQASTPDGRVVFNANRINMGSSL